MHHTYMLPNISQDELTLLEYLRKQSGGSDERIWLDPKFASRSLRVSMKQFAENSASLASHGFAGVRDFRPDANDVPSLECAAIWITKMGKDYLKRSPSGPCQATMSDRS
jgi:hypothetical protein